MRETTRETPRTDRSWLGQEMVDQRQHRIGSIVDVIFESDTGAVPDWAVVKIGSMGGSRFVPLFQAYRSRDGEVVVPYDRPMVRRTPRVDRDHVLSSDLRRKLGRIYGGGG